MNLSDAEYDALKAQWTDQFVQVKPNRPELTRFAGIVTASNNTGVGSITQASTSIAANANVTFGTTP